MSTRQRNTARAAGVLIASSLLVAACGDDGSETGGGGGVTLRFAWWGNEDRNAMTEEAIAVFEEQHPEIDVEAEYIEWTGYWDRLATTTAAGDPPDVMAQEERFVREYASRGALLDLSEHEDTIDMSELDPLVIGSGEVDGGLFAIPTGVNAYTILADPQIFAEAGVEMPDDSTWTWDDYVDISTAISEATAEDVYGAQDYGSNEAGFKIFARQRGEGLYDEAGELGFSPDSLAAWWEHSLRLRDGGGAPSASLSSEVQELSAPEQTLLGTNRAAMMWGWTNALEALSGAAGREIVLLRPPGESEHERTGIYLKPAQHYSVSADTEHPEEAAMLVDFLLNDPAAIDIIGSDRGLPINLEQRERISAELNEFQQAEAEFLADIADEVVDSPPAPPVGAGEVVDIIKRINVDVLFDRMTPDDAAQQFVSDVEAATG